MAQRPDVAAPPPDHEAQTEIPHDYTDLWRAVQEAALIDFTSDLSSSGSTAFSIRSSYSAARPSRYYRDFCVPRLLAARDQAVKPGLVLQTTDQSPLAQRRAQRRAGLDREAAHVQHARQWQQYVFERGSSFEEQAYELRARIKAWMRRRYCEDVQFREVDYGASDQPRSRMTREEDGEPVSPKTKPAKPDVERKGQSEKGKGKATAGSGGRVADGEDTASTSPSLSQPVATWSSRL
ncbi:hypothetical protein LTR53_009071 [Teratosphaeriaceae sp. CCFEE 6253]|nr:hypothetical protein LTR53_009071 [Teratosphaeriaceae sp. CCFEE 6253]